MRKKPRFKQLVSGEELESFLRLSPAQKLKWLDEAREFYFLAVPDKTKRLAERMRKEGW